MSKKQWHWPKHVLNCDFVFTWIFPFLLHKYIQFTVVEELNQKIFTFKKPESENVDFLS